MPEPARRSTLPERPEREDPEVKLRLPEDTSASPVLREAGPEAAEEALVPTRTAPERMANGDPRPSLEERYGSHEGYVKAVQRAAELAMHEHFLLPDDAMALVKAAQDSKVLR